MTPTREQLEMMMKAARTALREIIGECDVEFAIVLSAPGQTILEATDNNLGTALQNGLERSWADAAAFKRGQRN